MLNRGCPECGRRDNGRHQVPLMTSEHQQGPSEAEFLHSMKRRLLIIVVCLLAGVVVNVAVAWGCARWPRYANWISPDEDLQVRRSSRDVGWWNKHLVPLFDADIDMLWESRDLGVEIRVFVGMDSNHRDVYGTHVLSGLPAWSMSGEAWDAGQLPKWSKLFVDSGWIPLRPIWPGFVINTLFYAVILWLLIPGPFALRRFIRRRRGLCPGCGYLVGESDVCTECGIALVPG